MIKHNRGKTWGCQHTHANHATHELTNSVHWHNRWKTWGYFKWKSLIKHKRAQWHDKTQQMKDLRLPAYWTDLRSLLATILSLFWQRYNRWKTWGCQHTGPSWSGRLLALSLRLSSAMLWWDQTSLNLTKPWTKPWRWRCPCVCPAPCCGETKPH